MKKIVCLFAVILLCTSLALPVMAADNGSGFVPSVTYKGNPIVVAAESNMNVSGTDGIEDCIVITSVSQARNYTTDISEEDRALLLDLYAKLSDGTMSLPVEKNHVIRELVNIGFAYQACEMAKTHDQKGDQLEEAGVTLTLTLRLELGDNSVPMVMTYVDGKWEEIESVTRNADGTLTCVFEKIGPTAFIVGENPDGVTPFTGDVVGQNLGLWLGLMAVCAAGLVVVIALMRKKAV